jgi:hypothetical protein
MSDRRVVNQSPQRDRLTLARVAQIIGAGVIVGTCLTVALLASTMAAKLLVEQVGQVVFEDGIVLMTVFGLIAILAIRLVDHSAASRQPSFRDQDWWVDLSGHRVWTLGKWLFFPLIVLGSLIAAPSVVLSPPQPAPLSSALTPVAPAGSSLSSFLTPIKPTVVVVARRTLSANTTVTANDVELRTVQYDLRSDAETRFEDVIGKVLLVQAVYSQEILAPMLADPASSNAK